MSRADSRTERLRRAALSVGIDDWTVLRRFCAVRLLAWSRTPTAMRALAELVAADRHSTDDEVRDVAKRALRRVRGQAAIDAVCEVATATGDWILLGLAIRHDWLPSDAGRLWLMRLLYDVDRAIALVADDRSTLALARAAADEGARAQLARCVRRAGRVEWLRMAAQDQTHRRVELIEAEWEALVGTPPANRFEHPVQLIRQAPAIWAARLLARLEVNSVDPGGLVRLARVAVATPMTGGVFAQLAELERPHANNAAISDAVVSANGELLAASGYAGEVWLSHLPSGALANVLKPAEPVDGLFPPVAPHEQQISSLAIAPDGGLLAAGSKAGTIWLWHLPSGRPAGILRGPTGWMGELLITPDGTLLASSYTGSLYKEYSVRRVRLWHLPSGKRAADFKERCEPDHGVVAVSPDGRWLATSHGTTVRLRRLPSGKRVGTVPASACAMTFTPDSTHLLTGDPPRIWRLPDLALEGEPPEIGFFGALSPDGRRVATRYGNHLRVSRFPSGAEICRLDDAWTGNIGTYTFTHDGRLLVRSGYDTRLWRPPSPTSTLLPIRNSRLLTTEQTTLLAGKYDNDPVVWRYWPSTVAEIADKPVIDITPQDIEKLHQPRDDPGDRALAAFIIALARHYPPYDSNVPDG